MEDLSRRSLFLIVAGSVSISPLMAQHVHVALAEAKSLSGGAQYKPKCFTTHYFATLKKLADLIIPADEHSPGASDAGAAEFIDFLSSRHPDLAAIFNGGLAWVDETMQKGHGTDFLSSRPEDQKALLDSLAWKKNVTAESARGVPFWTWLRNMVVDAYYTSPAGVNDLGYMGNKAVSAFSVPDEAVQYVMKRSPFANEG
ncbi:MAG: gluconate 2-dehydrogenase subunit 3 family protein [Acidobacteriota bacterium]|nr:gluconate 2-dehydrogenase subunit 3 family protein [Acidobacteriota bacterium]